MGCKSWALNKIYFSVQTKFAKHTLYLILSGESFWGILNVSLNMGGLGRFWGIYIYKRNLRMSLALIQQKCKRAAVATYQRADDQHGKIWLFCTDAIFYSYQRSDYRQGKSKRFCTDAISIQVWLNTPTGEDICKLLETTMDHVSTKVSYVVWGVLRRFSRIP